MSSAGRSTSACAALTVTDATPGLRKSHCATPPIRPTKPPANGGASGPSRAKWMLTIGDDPCGTVSPGTSRAASCGGTGQYHPIALGQGHVAVVEHQAPQSIARGLDPAQAVAEGELRPQGLQPRDGGVDDRRGQTLARDDRPARRLAAQHGFRQHPGHQVGGCVLRRGVQAGDRQRLDEPVVEGAIAAQAPRHGILPPADQQPDQREVPHRADARHPAGRLEEPAAAEPEGPALSGTEILEREDGGRRDVHSGEGAGVLQKRHGRPVAGEHQVVAVVDRPAERLVEEGSGRARRRPARPHAR